MQIGIPSYVSHAYLLFEIGKVVSGIRLTAVRGRS